MGLYLLFDHTVGLVGPEFDHGRHKPIQVSPSTPNQEEGDEEEEERGPESSR